MKLMTRLILLAGLASAVACGGEGDARAAAAGAHSDTYAHTMTLMSGSASHAPGSFANLGEVLKALKSPNMMEKSFRGIVVGRITEVEPLDGFYAGEPDDSVTIRTSFSDPKVQWQSFRALVQVTEAVNVPTQDTWVTMGIYPHLDLKVVGEELMAMGEVMLPLADISDVAMRPNSIGVLHVSDYFIDVLDDGRLSLPFVGEDEARSMLKGYATRDEVLGAAKQR
ncbi:MAG: hypothetical protein V9E99_14115 [Microthrixaceae bacterium]